MSRIIRNRFYRIGFSEEESLRIESFVKSEKTTYSELIRQAVFQKINNPEQFDLNSLLGKILNFFVNEIKSEILEHLKEEEMENKLKRAREREKRKANNRKHNYYYWKRGIEKRYNMKPYQYLKMLRLQEYKCKCCNVDFFDYLDKKKSRFHVDHNHLTGEIRGLLCNNCNTGIGFFDDNTEQLKKAMLYLEGNSSV